MTLELIIFSAEALFHDETFICLLENLLVLEILPVFFVYCLFKRVSSHVFENSGGKLRCLID